MDQMIAYCGLICTNCEAYIATQTNDREARQRVAEHWTQEYKVAFTADTVLCDGCMGTKGRLVAHCDECPIRACASSRRVANCAHCADYACPELTKFFGMVPQAKTTLDQVRAELGRALG